MKKFYNILRKDNKTSSVKESECQAISGWWSNFEECRDFHDNEHVCIVYAGSVREALDISENYFHKKKE